MGLKQYKLIKKISLNHNVFEMIYEAQEEPIDFKYGQFVTFILPGIGGRAYSILDIDKKYLSIIIKKRELSDGGRGGSKYICEQEVGNTLNGVGPAGHFTLQDNNYNKLFLGTGTGFVPLYNQILGSLKLKQKGKLKLIFGVRMKEDLFYIEQLEKLKSENSNFDYEIYLSRDTIEKSHQGYVVDYLSHENIKDYEEFYVCGIPQMIDSSIELLTNYGIKKEAIFTEKY